MSSSRSRWQCRWKALSKYSLRLICKAGMIVMVGHSFQYHRAFMQLKSMIDRRDLGRLQHIPSRRLGFGRIRHEEDVFWNAEVATMLRSLRLHGCGTEKFNNIHVGLNSRLDTLQAAVLLCKLDVFDDELVSRQQFAARYTSMLSGVDIAHSPVLHGAVISTWASYTLRTKERGRLKARLKAWSIASAILYPHPLHKQPAYQAYPVANRSCAVAELAHSYAPIPRG